MYILHLIYICISSLFYIHTNDDHHVSQLAHRKQMHGLLKMAKIRQMIFTVVLMQFIMTELQAESQLLMGNDIYKSDFTNFESRSRGQTGKSPAEALESSAIVARFHDNVRSNSFRFDDSVLIHQVKNRLRKPVTEEGTPMEMSSDSKKQTSIEIKDNNLEISAKAEGYKAGDFTASQGDEGLIDTEIEMDENKPHERDRTELRTALRAPGLRIIKVVVASKTTAQVFRNFQSIGTLRTWTGAQEFVCSAKKGDSIIILAKGTLTRKAKYFGVAAMVQQGGKRWYMTGGPGRRAFKAISIQAMVSLNRPDLRIPRRKMCYLPNTRIIRNQEENRYASNEMAKTLFEYGAKYVWAKGAKVNDVIGIRLVVGGDECNKPKPSRRPKPTPSPNNTEGGKRCPCIVLKTGKDGECFQFRRKVFSKIPYKVGACRRRACGLKYKCVASGSFSRIMCLRRIGRYEVRSIGPVFKGKCKNVPLRPVQPYYAPYS